MNLDLSKMQHRLWNDSVSSMYDYSLNMKSDVDELIELYQNFDKQGFGEQEIKDVLSKRKEAHARDMRRATIIRLFNKNKALARALQKSVLDDDTSLISMFQELARDKIKKEKAKSQMLREAQKLPPGGFGYQRKVIVNKNGASGGAVGHSSSGKRDELASSKGRETGSAKRRRSSKNSDIVNITSNRVPTGKNSSVGSRHGGS